LDRRLGGSHSSSGRFGEEINCLALSGYRTTNRPVRSLVTITIPLILVILTSRKSGRKCDFILPNAGSVFRLCNEKSVPIPAAAQSKAWVCGRALAGIVGSNPTGGMDVCLLYSVCVVRYRRLCVGLITRPEDP
jgi:hypothetical protein